MRAEQALTQLIEKGLSKIPLSVTIGKVTSVDKENGTCEIQRDGQPKLYDVRLNAVIDSFESRFTIYPCVGSFVLCLMLGDASSYIVISTTQIDEVLIKIGNSQISINDTDISFNGGELGGLVKIDELTTAINQLVTAFNTHTHICPNGTTNAPIIKTPFFESSTYENKKVKQ